MAETKTTNLGATAYTPWHNMIGVTTFNVDTNLYIRSGPGGGYPLTARRLHPAGAWWTIAEQYNGWCREPNMDEWSSSAYISNPNVMNPTPGEFRIDSLQVTATRQNPWDKNLTIKYKWTWSNEAGTSEQYYNWWIYCYAAKVGGGEAQSDIVNRAKPMNSGNRDTREVTYTVEETSQNDSVTPGNYGVWYHGQGTYRSIDSGVGSQLTFSIPKYDPAQAPSCTAISVSNRATTSASLSGTFDNNGATIDKYQFRYRKTSTSTWTTLTETTSNSASLSSLTPNTKYEVSARAHNSVGWGSWKDGVYFWTKPLANKPTVSCTARTSTTATLVVTKNSTNYPDINLYSLEYKLTTASSWTSPTDKSSGSFSLSGLSANKAYYARGQTRTNTGGDGTTDWSDYSDTITFYTKPSAGTASATCVRNNTQNSLNIKVNTGGTYTPAANTYQVRYKLSTATTYTEMTASTNQTQTISGLTAGATYNIQVRARTGTGVDGSSTAWSNWSSAITVRVVKATTLTQLEPVVSFTSTTTQVQVKVTYTNNYPNANRIYYALTPSNVANPGPVSGMFVATSASPTTLTISKDYRGNALVPNTTYKLWVYMNQYKANSDWYTSGLNLYSTVLEEFVSTTPVVGTLSNVKCVRNNTYNSLDISATKSGTWTIYGGWSYRYKVSTAADTTYTAWSTASSSNKTISGLTAGQTYKIQVRGTTGTTSGGTELYSSIYEITVRVVKRPSMTLKIYRIRENEIGIQGTITDKGYPEVTSLKWNYSSNSYITSSYTPNTLVTAKTINFTSSVVTSQNYIFTNLYHFALYDIKARLTQYKAGSTWYTAGINNNTDFDIKDIELAMYNNRTQRLKGNNSGWKMISSIKGWNGSSWKNAGTNQEPSSNLDSYQVWARAKVSQIYQQYAWFHSNGNSHVYNNEAGEIQFWIPGIDRARFKGTSVSDNAYGGNLLDNKFSINLGTMQTSNSDTTKPYLSLNTGIYSFTRRGNSISVKRKAAATTNEQWEGIFAISGLDRLINLNLVDMMYVECCIDTIPMGSDSNYIAPPWPQFIVLENTSQHLAELALGSCVNRESSVKSKIMIPIPVASLLDLRNGYKLSRLQFFNKTYEDNIASQARSFIKAAGSIINISNFNIYYTLR